MMRRRSLVLLGCGVLTLTMVGCPGKKKPLPPPAVHFPGEIRFTHCLKDPKDVEQLRQHGLALMECRTWTGVDFGANVPWERIDQVRVSVSFSQNTGKQPKVVAYAPCTEVGKKDNIVKIEEAIERTTGRFNGSGVVSKLGVTVRGHWETESSKVSTTWGPALTAIVEAGHKDGGAGFYWRFNPGGERPLSSGDKNLYLMVAWPVELQQPEAATVSVSCYGDKETTAYFQQHKAVSVSLEDAPKRVASADAEFPWVVALCAVLLAAGLLYGVMRTVRKGRNPPSGTSPQTDSEQRT